jgi:hypothetical protein
LAQGLRELGWTEGRNRRIEFRGIASGGFNRNSGGGSISCVIR